MEVLHRGFDGLDLSLKASIDPTLSTALEDAKEQASRLRRDALFEWNGTKMLVAESGARGGYAFRASTGPMGATWFFKRPNSRDPWGIRVSMNSLGLAALGLGVMRASLYDLLGRLGVVTTADGVSIGRVDYAVDVLAPGLAIDPQHFVMHSHCSRKDHISDSDMEVNGRSGRVTSVTIGKMPGRQVIVYDKRAEVLSRRKDAWWEIWNSIRASAGRPPLDRSDDANSRVWRVELRAGKKHLHERWSIRTWSDFDNRLCDVFAASLDAIRHLRPSGDSNRSRWTETGLWQTVRREMEGDLFEFRGQCDPQLLREIQRDEYAHMLDGQIAGLIVSRAALDDCPPPNLGDYAALVGKDVSHRISADTERFTRKLIAAKDRHIFR